MVARNYFEIARENINFRKYEDLITEKLIDFVGSLKTHFNWLNPTKIIDLFWGHCR